MKVNRLKYIDFISLVLLLLLPSCNIREDMSGCPGYFLLDYTAYPEEILDAIEPDSRIKIFVFDAQNVCSGILNYSYSELMECDYEFSVPREYSGRNVLVWHGGDHPHYNDDSMKVGVSLDDFYLELVKDADGDFGHVPSTLWCSELEAVEFCASKTRHRIHMMRLNTQINVSMKIAPQDDTSVVAADMSDFNVCVSAKDDIYHCDCTLSDHCTRITYDNSEDDPNNSHSNKAHVGTLRLMVDSRSELSILDLNSSEKVTINGSQSLNLIKYMLDSRSDISDPQTSEIDDQRFLDLNKVWDIELVVALNNNYYVAVSLTINGWTVWFDNADLS